MLKNALVYLLILFLIVLFYPVELPGQEQNGSISIGINYSYTGMSDEIGVASGIGLDVLKKLNNTFGIGLKTAWFIPVNHTTSSFNMVSKYRQNLLAVSVYGRINFLRLSYFDVYGIAAIVNHRTAYNGEHTYFIDLPPYGTSTVLFDTKKYGMSPLIGGSVEINNYIDFYIEPSFVMLPSPHFVLSTGMRVPL